MARTLSQQMGDSHEADIAEWTQGSTQKGSGNQWHRQGDTKNGEHLVAFPVTSDGKSTMGASISVSRAMWNKIVEQTFNQNPALFLRFYEPGETVRNVDIDLAVVRSGLFVELLEAARKWAAIEEEIAYEGKLEAEYVVSLLQMVKGSLPALTSETDASRHVYLSTSCFHGDHTYCQSNTGMAGEKIPGKCKFCASKCVCGCHQHDSGCDCCR